MFYQYLNDKFGGKKLFLKSIDNQLRYLFGMYANYRAVPLDTKRVVFVCQGNICRSALAEVVFQELSAFPVASFGLNTHTGKPANSRMINVAEALGYDLTAHQTTSLSDFIIQEKDLLVCMQPEHVQELNNLDIKNEKLLIGTMLHPSIPRVSDPYSANDQFMSTCANQICKSTEVLSSRIDGLINV